MPRVPKIKKPKVRLISHDFSYLRTIDEIRRFLVEAEAEEEKTHVLYATALYRGSKILAKSRSDDSSGGKLHGFGASCGRLAESACGVDCVVQLLAGVREMRSSDRGSRGSPSAPSRWCTSPNCEGRAPDRPPRGSRQGSSTLREGRVLGVRQHPHREARSAARRVFYADEGAAVGLHDLARDVETDA